MSSKKAALSSSWSREEFGSLDLGDSRLTERLMRVSEDLSGSPLSGIHAACGDWASSKAAYRLFDNEKVSSTEILGAHFQQTVARMRAHARVFAIQDTTYLDYTAHPSTSGLGPIGTRAQKHYGFVKHTTLVVSESGLPLGCLTDKVWVRDEGVVGSRKSKPLSEKESYKWIEALGQTKSQAPAGVEVISIGDREADIYDFFVEAQESPFVIRATQDRGVVSDESGTLKALMESQPVAGEITAEAPARGNQSARSARLNVHFTKTTLIPPYRSQTASAEKLPPVDVNAVWVVETHPPGEATPLEWLLLTNVEVSDFTDAVERISWYCLRWQIEVYFKVLKSGTKVQDCRLQTQDRLLRYIALMSVIAWRLYWMTWINRHAPTAECTCVLTTNEWQALYCVTHKTRTLPEKIPDVSQVIVWIAKLGGFLGRKSDGNPGVTVIWRGWQRLRDIADTFSIFHDD